MAYNGNTNWQQNDIVKPDDMNRIEQGITDLETNKIDKTGTAAMATKLETPRLIRTNLESVGTASFDGSTDVTPGVQGVLPVANGGTGASTVAGVRNALGLGNTTGALPVANGGTGSDTEEEANRTLTYRNVPPSTDLPYDYPEGIHFYYASGSSGLPYVPSNFGLIFSMRAGTETTQLWYSQPSGNIFRRGANQNTWDGSPQRGWIIVGNANTVATATLE